MLPSRSRSARSLSAGAALVTCSLASAAVPLQYSTLDSASGFMSHGSTTGSFSYAGPATAMNTPLVIGGGSGNGTAEAYHVPSYLFDFLFVEMYTTSSYTSGLSIVTFVLTVGSSVQFVDLGGFLSDPGAWTANGVSLSNGDVLAAGQYSFQGQMIYSGGPTGYLRFGFGLTGPASAVPLPGAAGLAALGLAGLSRRRRR